MSTIISPPAQQADTRGMPGNALLGQLSPEELAVITPDLDEVTLRAYDIISEPRENSEFFFFPRTAVFSLVTTMKDGRVVESATVGNEGLAGIAPFLGDGAMLTRTIVQISGHADRIRVNALLEAITRAPRIGTLLKRYTQVFVNQLAQSVACNSVHSIHERCARWLLMTHDRVGPTDSFELTQEFLSYMLGVRREGVSGASRALKEQGVIRYSRGHMTVMNRALLEVASCECYQATRGEYDRLSVTESRLSRPLKPFVRPAS